MGTIAATNVLLTVTFLAILSPILFSVKTIKMPLSKYQKKKSQRKRKIQSDEIKVTANQHNLTVSKAEMENIKFQLANNQLEAAKVGANFKKIKKVNKMVESLTKIVQEKMEEFELLSLKQTRLNYESNVCKHSMSTEQVVEKIEEPMVLNEELSSSAESQSEEIVVAEITEFVENTEVSTKKPKDSQHCFHTACPEPGLHRCSRCRSVSYCSEACSRAAWGKHREECDKEEEKRKKKKLRKEKKLIV